MLFETCSLIRQAMRLPSPVAFTFGGVNFYWFGVLFAAGIIVALVFTYMEVTRKGLDPDTWIDLCLVLIPCGIIGARLWYVLGHLSAYKGSFFNILQVWDGGLSIYGAAVFCIVGLYLYALKKKVGVGTLLDTMAPGVILAQAVIVWGDFFQQQDYGRLVENPALQWFPFAVLIEKTGAIHYAVFFYEFLVCLAIFAALWLIIRKRVTHNGEVFSWYLVLFFGTRMLLNLLRESDTTLAGRLRPTQLFCILLFVLGVVALLLMKKLPATTAFVQGAPAAKPDSGEPDAAASAATCVVEAPGDERAPSIDEAILAAEANDETEKPASGADGATTSEATTEAERPTDPQSPDPSK